jgi:hypothetical protein
VLAGAGAATTSRRLGPSRFGIHSSAGLWTTRRPRRGSRPTTRWAGRPSASLDARRAGGRNWKLGQAAVRRRRRASPAERLTKAGLAGSEKEGARGGTSDSPRLMPKVGIEPTRAFAHRILSPARLPIPPLRRTENSSPTVRRLGKTALLPSLTVAIGRGRRGFTGNHGSPVSRHFGAPRTGVSFAGSARPRSCRASRRLSQGEGGGSRGNHGFTRVHLRPPLLGSILAATAQ